MNLYETIKWIEDIASTQPNINTIVESGNIYDLNADEFELKYSAFCISQRTHQRLSKDNMRFNFTMFYVDRLTSDHSNKLDIQSNAVDFFNNILNSIDSSDAHYVDYEYGEINPFTQRFTAECAGAYMDFSIIVPLESTCENIY